MVCVACEQYAAAGRGSTLCGNCAMLKPKELETVKAAAKLRREMSAQKADPVAMITELQIENAQLRADNESLQEMLDKKTAPK